MIEPLPHPDDREWILDELAELVRRCGWRQPMLHPILEPSPRFFPDPITPDIHGAYILLHRLLCYAGLDGSRVELQEVPPEPESREIAWFLADEGGALRFAYVSSLRRDEVTLVGALAPEVAHSLPHRKGRDDPD